MKKLYWSAPLLLAVLVAPVTSAQNLGVGLIVGEPTGLSIKKWLDSKHALDLGLGWSSSGSDSFHLHGDYLFHQYGLLRGLASDLDLSGNLTTYLGLGARAKFRDNDRHHDDDDTLLGVRVPLGISYQFADAPVDLFIEAVPTLDLIPDSDFSVHAALGARYYF
ncbi:DUF3996 domain-containing protein [Marinospirillum sp.]|uniref:DUF3996 domain-containing protein n=1 Tax=Marinospirillum sp. TaxID=2183934 RepID=UPI00286FC3F8|nr:DUF3996 domain-containing protein [Marinospirillum sp.]MDR9468495.1 DUF3996 domain-containing protein [Marinospirillum sp.]